jgi:hypothetical protein
MTKLDIFSVSGSSNSHQALVLRRSSHAGAFTNQPWGRRLTPTWRKPELVAAAKTKTLPRADVGAIYLPGLLVATEAAAVVLENEEIEFLPATVGSEEARIINPLFTIHRFREAGANFTRVPSGAILFLESADFFAQDIPVSPSLFWLHDGNFPRFLLCTASFVAQVAQAGISGLTFKALGHATTDA